MIFLSILRYIFVYYLDPAPTLPPRLCRPQLASPRGSSSAPMRGVLHNPSWDCAQPPTVAVSSCSVAAKGNTLPGSGVGSVPCHVPVGSLPTHLRGPYPPTPDCPVPSHDPRLPRPLTAFLHQHKERIEASLRSSVAASTQRRYRDSWPRWLTFLSLAIGPAPDLYVVPHTIPPAELLQLLLAFLSYLRFDLALSGTAITIVLTGLRFELRARLFDSPVLTAPQLRGMCRSYIQLDSRQGVTCARGKRIPFNVALVLSLSAYADTHHHIRHRMRAIGALMAFFCGLRASEYSVCPGTDHTIRASAVEFEYCPPANRAGTMVPSSAISHLDFQFVRSVRITVHTAKNIAPGQGQPVWFSTRARDDDGVELFPIAQHLFAWASVAELSQHDVFLSYPDPDLGRVPLRYAAMNSALKAAARAAGVDPRKCGTHSLRGGTATAMVAGDAGVPALLNACRWRSVPTAAAYPDRTTQSNDHQLRLLQCSTSVTTRDIRMARCLPPRSPPAVPPAYRRPLSRSNATHHRSRTDC